MDGSFAPFGPVHALALGGVALAAAGCAAAGCALAGDAARRLGWWLGFANLVVWTGGRTWWLLPERFDVADSLPLQVCDVVSALASVVLMTGAAWARPLLYCFAFGLSTQALATPSLVEGPSDPAFWMFWVRHGFAVVAAVWDVAVGGYRPTWRDWRYACAAALAYGALVTPVNLALGVNYGFLGDSSPLQPSLIDVLGPWPLRVVWIGLLGALAMALVVLPWTLGRRSLARLR